MTHDLDVALGDEPARLPRRRRSPHVHGPLSARFPAAPAIRPPDALETAIELPYRLLIAPGSELAGRRHVSWNELSTVPLCLLTSDMQNRRIIDRALRQAGTEAMPTLTSNSIIVLYTHVKTGRWSRKARLVGVS